MKHVAMRRQGRNHDRALTVGAVLYINNRPMPTTTGIGRHRNTEGE